MLHTLHMPLDELQLPSPQLWLLLFPSFHPLLKPQWPSSPMTLLSCFSAWHILCPLPTWDRANPADPLRIGSEVLSKEEPWSWVTCPSSTPQCPCSLCDGTVHGTAWKLPGKCWPLIWVNSWGLSILLPQSPAVTSTEQGPQEHSWTNPSDRWIPWEPVEYEVCVFCLAGHEGHHTRSGLWGFYPPTHHFGCWGRDVCPGSILPAWKRRSHSPAALLFFSPTGSDPGRIRTHNPQRLQTTKGTECTVSKASSLALDLHARPLPVFCRKGKRITFLSGTTSICTTNRDAGP